MQFTLYLSLLLIDSLSLYYSGIYKVYINDKHISTYTHTGLFGELALLYNMPR